MPTVKPNDREMEIAIDIDPEDDAESVAQRIADYREELLTKAEQAVAGVINVGGPSDVSRVFAQLRGTSGEPMSASTQQAQPSPESPPPNGDTSGAVPKSDTLEKDDAVEEP